LGIEDYCYSVLDGRIVLAKAPNQKEFRFVGFTVSPV